MRRPILFCKIAILCILLAAQCGSFASQRKPPRPGSFVRYSAETVSQLVDQILTNNVVGKRYSKMFKMQPQQLAKYFRDNLQVTKLSKPLKVKMHFISKTGKILVRNCWLPAGKKVFATRDGTPVLDIGCGNPLTDQLPVIETKVKGTTQTVTAIQEEKLFTSEPQGAEETVQKLAPPEAVTEAVTEELTPQEYASAIFRTPEDVDTGPAPVGIFEPALTENKQMLSFLQLARGIVPALFLAAKDFGLDQESLPPVIPEPSTSIPLIIGTLVAIRQMCRRK
ncbi:MAG: hypothetical protein ACUVRS_04100 [Armatimonadota bacterium]